MSIRVVFFGNSQNVFSNRHFAALLETPCAIVGLVDAPAGKRGSTNAQDSSAFRSFMEIGKRKRIPAFEPANPNMPEFVEPMKQLRPDLFVAVGYTNLLKDDLLSIPRLLSANFHASLLPSYRGKSPLFWALRNQEKWAGLTVHAMDPGLDTGDIIYQVKARTRKSDCVAALYDRIMDKSVGLVQRLIADLENGCVPRTTQDPTKGSYFSGAKEEDYHIDWSKPAGEIRAWINATPGKCWARLPAGNLLYLWNAGEVRGSEKMKPGTLLELRRSGCVIAAGKEAVWIRDANLDKGAKRISSLILNEMGIEEGTVLP